MSEETDVVQNDKFSKFAAVQSPEKMTVMKFLDTSQMRLYHRKKSNWLVSIIFFCYMMLNIVFPYIARVEKGLVRDVLSFILSLAVYAPLRTSEITVAALVFTVLVLLLLLTVALNMLLLSYNFPQIVDRYLDVFFRAVPMLFVPLVNVFLRTCYSDTKHFGPFASLFIVLHLVIIVFIALIGVLANVGPYLTNHAFLARTPMKNVILTTFFLVITHLPCGYLDVSEYIVTVWCIVSLIVCVIAIYSPLYVHPFMNVLLITLLLTSSVIPILLLSDTKYRYAPYILITCCFVGSLVIVYGLMCLRMSNATGFEYVYYLYVYGRRNEAKFHLEELYELPSESSVQLDSSIHSESSMLLDMSVQPSPVFNIKQPHLRMAVQLGLELRIKNIDKLIQQYGERGLTMTHEIFFIWSATHCYASLTGGIPCEVDRSINMRIKQLECMENEFWRLTWLSHRQSLSKLAADMGRERYILHQFFECSAERFPELWKPNDIRNSLINELTAKKSMSNRRCCSRGHPLLFLYFSIYAFCIGFLSTMYFGNGSQKGEIESALLISNFVGNTSKLTLDWVYNATNDIARNATIRCYDELLASSHPLINAFLGHEINGTNVSNEYEIFMECIETKPTVPGQCTSKGTLLRLFIEMHIDRLTYYSVEYLVDSKLFKQCLFGLTLAWLVVVFGSGLGTYLHTKRFVINLFKPFTRIPKSVVKQQGTFNCDDDVNGISSLPICRKYTIFEILPATTIFYITSFVGMLLCIGGYLLSYAVTLYDVRHLTDISRKLGRLQNLQVALPIIASYSVQQPMSVLSQAAQGLDEMLQAVGTDPFYEEFMYVVPNDIYTLLFSLSLQSGSDVYMNMTSIVVNMSANLHATYSSYSSYRRFSTMRFAVYLTAIIVIGFFCLYIVLNVLPMMIAEQNEGVRLFPQHTKAPSDWDEFDIKLDESTKSERRYAAKDKKIEEWKLPVTYALLDQDMIVEQITNQAKQLFRLSKGSSFIIADHVSNDTMTQITACVHKFKKEMKPGVVVISIPDSGTVHLSPFYVIESDKKLLRHVAVLFSEGVTTTVETADAEHAKLFYSFFPRFVPVDEVPFSDLPEKASQMYLMLVKLVGFHSWASTVTPQQAAVLRSNVSTSIDELCTNDKSAMMKIMEQPDVIVLRADRVTVNQNWSYMRLCLPIGQSIIDKIKEIVANHEASIEARVLVFRANDPGFYLPDMKLGCYDANSGIVNVSLDYERSALPWRVNYTFLRGSLNGNVTKVRKGTTRDGQDYYIWLIV